MQRKRRYLGMSVLWGSLVTACGAPVESDGDRANHDIGMIQLSLETVPDKVACLHVETANTTRSKRMARDVAPGQRLDLRLDGLPTGAATVMVSAFEDRCGVLASDARPTWLSESTPLILRPGIPAILAIIVRPNGILQLGVSFAPDEPAPLDEIKFAPPANANAWFGGDDRTGIRPRSVGQGQRIVVPRAIDMKRFGLSFVGGFTRSMQGGPSVAVTLVLQIRDEMGMILKSAETTVPPSFFGGWVYWSVEHSLGPQTYNFTAYVKDGLSVEMNSGIQGVVDGTDPGERIVAIVTDSEASFAPFSAWFPATWDLLYSIQGHFR